MDRLTRPTAPLLAALLFISLISPAEADNGSVVVTSVVQDIHLDGDLGDWSDDIPWHPIGLNLYGDAENGDSDLSAQFRVGVDPSNLKVYCAVEVRDDSRVEPPMGHRSWNSHDSVDVFLGLIPSPPGTSKSKSKKTNVLNLKSELVERYDRKTGIGVYELSFDLRDAGYTDFSQAICAAFTVAYNDKDEDGSLTVKFWSPEINKAVCPLRRGDLVISGPKRGLLKGKLTRGTGDDDVGRLLLHFQSADNPQFKVALRTDPGGTYELELPEGHYERSSANLPTVTLDVRDGVTTVDSIECPSLLPRRIALAEFDLSAKTNQGFAPELYKTNRLNGLPDSRIHSLAQDAQGTLWIGTGANLARYDGSRLNVFSRELTNRIKSMWHDSTRNRVWIAGKMNVGYISDGFLTTFPIFDDHQGSCVGPTHDGSVCIGTDNGLFLWDEERFRYRGIADGLPDEKITAIASDEKRGITWIGTNDGLATFDGKNFELFSQQGLEDMRIVSLFTDSRGRLWVGTATSLYYYDNDQFELVRKHESERESYARAFAELPNGDIKVGAYNQLVTIPRDYPATPCNVHTEISAFDAVFLDRDQQLWLGSEKGELRRKDQGLKKEYSISGGNCRFLQCVGEHLWFLQVTPAPEGSTQKWTVVRMDSSTKELRLFPVTPPNDNGPDRPLEITNFHATKIGVWCGTKTHGVLELQDNKWVSLKFPSDSYFEIASLMVDSQERLWVTTLRNIYRMEDGKLVLKNLSPRQNYGDFLHISASPNGNLAVGTTEGVFVVNEQLELVNCHHESNGMISNVPRVVTYDNEGTLWLATFRGLQSINDDVSRAYRAQDGMLDDHPCFFIQQWGNEIWCGSHAGINRISMTDGVIQHIVSNDGTGEHQIGSAVRDGESMWLGGESGIWRYRRSNHPPHLSIADVFTTESLGPQQDLSVTTDLKTLRVELHATSLKTRSSGVIYQHQVDDGEWIKTEPQVELDLPPKGDYQLRFRVVDRDLLVSEPCQISLSVTPPYSRWLKNFTLVTAVCASLILGLLYFARIRNEKSNLEQSVKEQSAQLSDLERQLVHAEKMKAMGTLASGVAHDFNNSLTAINGNAELAMLSETAEEKDELISHVLAVTRQAAELTQSMLMFGGKGSSEKTTIDINIPVLEAEKILRRTLPASIAFECKVANHPVCCKADSGQIQTVIMNLALNARDAMPKGGTLRLHLETVDDKIQILMSDDGCGIPEAARERIFEPFYTEKPRGKGTGLGLSIVHAIVENHEGKISVTSVEGKGTEFRLLLPLSEYTMIPESEDAPTVSLHCDGGRVLVADDQPLVRKTLATALNLAGFEVETACDGPDFVKQAAQSHFDLVVVDVDMPGENGWDSLKRVRETNGGGLAIVISGLPSDERRFDSRNTAFLRKPFSLQKLTETAAELLRSEA